MMQDPWEQQFQELEQRLQELRREHTGLNQSLVAAMERVQQLNMLLLENSGAQKEIQRWIQLVNQRKEVT